MTKLASKPPLQEELAHKYDPASWDADGYPTADKHRAPLSDKVPQLLACAHVLWLCGAIDMQSKAAAIVLTPTTSIQRNIVTDETD